MAETFAYDLVSFLRVLYRRRRFIAYGALGMMLLAAVASLVWPQTWRATGPEPAPPHVTRSEQSVTLRRSLPRRVTGVRSPARCRGGGRSFG